MNWVTIFIDAIIALLSINSLTSPSTNDNQTPQRTLLKYDEALGQSAMFYSAATYCDPVALLTWNCGIACSSNPGILAVRPIVYVSVKSYTYGYVTYNPLTQNIVVAFRGTNGLPTDPTFRSIASFLNWETNLDFKMANYEDVPNARVHSGFYNVYNLIRPQVLSSVHILLEVFPQASILVTGHSLGGALATLCGIDLKQQNRTEVQIFTFGSPRIGNRELVDFIYSLFSKPDASIYRIVHANDVVPQVPTMLQTYVHVGIEIWYMKDDLSYRQCVLAPQVYEDPTCSLTQIVNPSIAAHLTYLTYNITNLCPVSCPDDECSGCPLDSNSTITSPPIVNLSQVFAPLLLAPCENCAYDACNKETRDCLSGCTDSRKWWGPRCDQICVGNCNEWGCNQITGFCNNECSDSRKWWGPHCDKPCGGHCGGRGCNKITGHCLYGCSDDTKWWEPRCCSNPCIGHCSKFYGCDTNNGLCKVDCEDSRKWWGDHCDQPCLGHCDLYGCNMDNGLCKVDCEDSRKWWGDQCDNPCLGHCDLYGCRKDNGLCKVDCENGKKWWGDQCDQPCTCPPESYRCDKKSGHCIY